MRNSEMKVRLSVDLRRWLADQALRAHCSMNAVVVGAIESLKAARTDRLADDRHAAAVETAISLGRLPKGTEIMLRPDRNARRTEILVRRPSQTGYQLLARVQDDEVVFAHDHASAVGAAGV